MGQTRHDIDDRDLTEVVGPPHEHVIESEVDGDVSLYDASSESVIVLNQTASDVWRLCDGTMTLEEIIDSLATAYGSDSESIAEDVQELIDSLRSQGLLPS